MEGMQLFNEKTKLDRRGEDLFYGVITNAGFFKLFGEVMHLFLGGKMRHNSAFIQNGSMQCTDVQSFFGHIILILYMRKFGSLMRERLNNCYFTVPVWLYTSGNYLILRQPP